MVGADEIAPHPLLAPYVKCLWRRERDFSQRPGGFAITPDSYIELTVSIGAGWQIGGQLLPQPRICVVGLLDTPLQLIADGPLLTVGARCYAWGFAPLLGVAPRTPLQLLPQYQQLARSIGHALARGEHQAALEQLHAFLLERARSAPPPPFDVQRGAAWLFAQRGAARIADLAEVCSRSHRQLERQFLAAVGITPKALARKMRFEQALAHLYREPQIAGAALADEYGFADQAHLIREFRTLSGQTPGQLAATFQLPQR